MTRLRQASVIAALALLPAGTANAECAWVLWSTMMKRSTQYVNTLADEAFQTKEECDRAYWEARTAEKDRRSRDPDTKYFYVCLPDTVDPRGPKGK